MVRNLYLLGTLFLVFSTSLFAQVGSGTLKGTLIDSETGEPLPFVNIVLQDGDRQVTGSATDFDGKYTIKPIPPGTYDVLVSYVGYNAKKIEGVRINNEKITFVDIELDAGVRLEEFEVIEYTVPLIDKDGGSSGGTVTREDITKMPGRSANSIAATVGGVQQNGAGTSIRGAREGNTFYYIDGIKIRGNTNLPKAAIEEVQVMTGGIPASYGDATGGIIAITTRGASSRWFGGIDIITSGFANQDGDGIGLDRYSRTQVEGVLSGPLLWKKDAEGNKERPLLGFFLSANYRNFMDNRPLATGSFRIKDDVRNRLVADPLSFSLQGVGSVGTDGGFYIDEENQVVPASFANPQIQANGNAQFIRPNDWEEVPARQFDRNQAVSLTAKLDVATTPNIDLSFGGTFDYGIDRSWSYANSLFNASNNGESRDQTFRVFGRFTQRFANSTKEEGGLIKNAFYSLMVDYSQRNFRSWDPTHQDNLFNYGYVGRFETNEQPFFLLINDVSQIDTLDTPGYYQQGFTPVEIGFTPSDVNSDLAAYTSDLYEFYEQNNFTVATVDQIDAAGGLRNGRTPASVYGLYSPIGSPFNSYSLFDNNQFRITGSGSADIGNHAITLGFEFEQYTERSFGASPVGLWNLARQYTNAHLQQFDFSQPSDTLPSTPEGFSFFTYDRIINLDNQQTFDRNLRRSLGLNPDGDDIIYVDELDPETFELDMFSADELLNQGANLVSYSGYDYKGDRLTGGRPTIDDFFTERDENGNLTRPIAAFEPIYIAGYIMDKFTFDDIIFNVGLRVDRFDANQSVLKDQFVIGEALTVADTRNIGEGGRPLTDAIRTHPSVVNDDWVVYVNNVQNPTSINGYRDGNTWYNAQGVEIPDPTAITAASGQIAPLLADPDAVGENLNSGAFEDYEPQWNVMPRIAFSFPISDEAVFFAHYDILTQRPTGQNINNPIDYLFIQNRNNSIANPNLRPTRTIDYELGFQQVLSRTSSLKIAAFYRETRDEIQARRLFQAYPVSYTSFDNFDFGTVKGLTLTYDLRRTGNITLRVAYTLQFASATGSNAGSAINLVNSGEPNLRIIFPTTRDQRHLLITTFDYRYGTGADYNGPVIGGKQVLANTGLNIVSTLGSGTPYSQQRQATGTQLAGGGGAPQLEGQVNGSRLPWQFNIDAQLDKSWQLKFGKGEEKKTAFLNAYLLVNNVLNTMNIINVYRFTGNPDDDGYLSSPIFEPAIEAQIDPEAFRQMYALKVNSPFNFSVPRTIQLGLRLDF